MALTVKEAKVNSSRSYSDGKGLTKASHPLSFAESGRVTDNSRFPRVTKTVAIEGRGGRRGTGRHSGLGSAPRTIVS